MKVWVAVIETFNENTGHTTLSATVFDSEDKVQEFTESLDQEFENGEWLPRFEVFIETVR